MKSTYKATTSTQHRVLLEGLAQAGYKVGDASRLNAHNCIRIEHNDDQAAEVEAAVRAIDPNAESL